MHLRSYWEQTLLPRYNELLDQAILELKTDISEFTIVDGEEGDHGIIKYLDADNNVVAIKNVEAGDNEYIEVTEYGKPIIIMKMNNIFTQMLKDYLAEKK